MFSRLSDPADVVLVLLPNALSHIGTDLLQDGGSDVISQRQVTGVARSADPAERSEAQGEDISVGRVRGGEGSWAARERI